MLAKGPDIVLFPLHEEEVVALQIFLTNGCREGFTNTSKLLLRILFQF